MLRLYRVSAASALVAGLLEMVAQLIAYVPDHPGLEALYGAIDGAFLLALIGLIAMTAPRISGWGLALLLAATLGVASIVGPDRTVFGIDFYLAGSALFVLSLALAAPFLARLPGLRVSAMAWGLGGLAALASGLGGGALAFTAASLSLAAGFLALTPALWRGGD